MPQDLSRSTLLGADSVPEEHLEAYRANYECHRTGISIEECIESYNRNAEKYEQNLSPSRYRGYVIAAEMLEKYKNNDKSVQVIDIGAGTGFLGSELKKRGYNNIDGLEPSSEMLKLAAKKDVYRNLYCDVIGGTQVRIPDDTYDVLASSGSMGEGHIPCKGLTEMIRIVKPGGLVVIVMRQEYLEYVKEYKDRLVPYMKELEESGKWRCLEQTVVPNYAFGKDGVAFVCRVSESGFSPMTSQVI